MRILLIVLLAGAVLGTLVLLGNDAPDEPAAIAEAAPVEDVTLEYLVFGRSVSQGDFIRGDDLKWVSLNPEEASVPSWAIQRDDTRPVNFDGALVMSDAKQDDFVNRRIFLLPQESRFLASVLQPGKRAVSIKIDAVSGNSGLVQPGDRSDVILFTQLDSKGRDMRSGHIAKTILENVRVIAIDSKIAYRLYEEGEEESDPGVGSGARRKWNTATLELTPHQAEIITIAQEMGKLSLSLRSYFEQEADKNPSPEARQSTYAHDVIREFSVPKEVEIVELVGSKKRQKTFVPSDQQYN